jgi:hypothetical protein
LSVTTNFASTQSLEQELHVWDSSPWTSFSRLFNQIYNAIHVTDENTVPWASPDQPPASPHT